MSEKLKLARRFHDAYERLAPQFGYETQAATRRFDPNSPNGKLMIATCAEIICAQPTATSDLAVKTLDWKASTPHSWEATAIGLRYYVWFDRDEGSWTAYSEGHKHWVSPEHETLESGQAAADAEHTSRIRSTLTTKIRGEYRSESDDR